MTKLLLFSAVFGMALSAQSAPDYLPLAVGNQWIYRSSLGSPVVVEITGIDVSGAQPYFIMKGWQGAGEERIRRADSGAILVLDPETKQEKVWIDFSAPIGEDRPSAAHPCSGTAAVESRRFSGKFAVGDLSEITQIRFGANVCADAGLTSDYYLPYVGLLRRTETTIAGPRSYELIYARLGGAVMITANEQGFSASTDYGTYAVREIGPPPRMLIRMTLRNVGLAPVELTFPSSQEYELVIRKEGGQEVYRWSATRSFLAVLKTYSFSGEKNWAEELPLADGTGKALAPGRYMLDVLLTTSGGPSHKAQLTFEIVRATN